MSFELAYIYEFVAIIVKSYFPILSSLVLLASCGQRNNAVSIEKSNSDSVFILFHRIDSIKKLYRYSEADYKDFYNLTDRIKPFCDNLQGNDKSKLPEIYNFCAEMLRRRCYIEKGKPYTIKDCKYKDDIIDCCLRAIPISRQIGDTLSLNYTNSLGLLADAYEKTGRIQESLKLRYEILAKYQKMFNEMSDMTAYAYYEIGKTYELNENLESANSYFNKVLKLQKTLESKYLTEDIDSIKAFKKRFNKLLK